MFKPFRRLPAGLIVLCLLLLPLAQPGPAAAKEVDWAEASFSLTQGYRYEDFDWSIAGPVNGNDVNILSELSWQDLHIYETKAEFAMTLTKLPLPLQFDADFGIGWVAKGEVQDSDYGGDNRTGEFSRSYSDALDSMIYDYSLAVGPVLQPFSRLQLVPKAGYAWSLQRLKMRDGVQVLSDFASVGFDGEVPLGPFAGLDSTYDADWTGPWVGLQVALDLTKTLRLKGEFGYYWFDYDAEADWNLRSDFAHPVSYTHEAEGTSSRASLQLDWLFRKHAAIGVGAGYQQWETDAGIDTTFFADGSSGSTPLNGVNRESWSAWLALTGYF